MEEKRDNFDEIIDELSSCNSNASIQNESKKVKNCKVINETKIQLINIIIKLAATNFVSSPPSLFNK